MALVEASEERWGKLMSKSLYLLSSNERVVGALDAVLLVVAWQIAVDRLPRAVVPDNGNDSEGERGSAREHQRMSVVCIIGTEESGQLGVDPSTKIARAVTSERDGVRHIGGGAPVVKVVHISGVDAVLFRLLDVLAFRRGRQLGRVVIASDADALGGLLIAVVARRAPGRGASYLTVVLVLGEALGDFGTPKLHALGVEGRDNHGPALRGGGESGGRKKKGKGQPGATATRRNRKTAGCKTCKNTQELGEVG